jgi:hypothetical protein
MITSLFDKLMKKPVFSNASQASINDFNSFQIRSRIHYWTKIAVESDLQEPVAQIIQNHIKRLGSYYTAQYLFEKQFEKQGQETLAA